MARLPHGYTNRTRRLRDGAIEKTFEGPRRYERAARELACLQHLGRYVPVPKVLGYEAEIPRIQISELAGRHGQDLIMEGHASAVLTLAGRALAQLQRVPATTVPGLAGGGDVIVHGDFGPQNMLFDIDRAEVTGIIDWEFARAGERIDDLAWAEWIVRMHQPDSIRHLDVFFSSVGLRPSWNERHVVMIRRCEELLTDSISSGDHDAIARWTERYETTCSWTIRE